MHRVIRDGIVSVYELLELLYTIDIFVKFHFHYIHVL